MKLFSYSEKTLSARQAGILLVFIVILVGVCWVIVDWQMKSKFLGGVFTRPDPVGELKGILKSEKNQIWFHAISSIKIDVTKTDSLVSPYAGIVTYKEGDCDCTILLAYQEKRWAISKANGKSPPFWESQPYDKWVYERWTWAINSFYER